MAEEKSVQLRAPQRPLYLLLGVLFAFAAVYQVRFSLDLLDDLRNRHVALPFGLGSPWPSVAVGGNQAGPGGVLLRDRVVLVDGEPLSGLKDLARAARRRDPGDHLQVVVNRDGEILRVSVPLAVTRSETPAFVWGFAIVIWFLTPALSLALGFWVAAARPGDARAWLLLGLMVSFSQLSAAGNIDFLDWPDGMRQAAIAYKNLAGTAWPVWMMLFGLYFPRPSGLERRHSWAKWLIIAPMALLAILRTVRALGVSEDYRAVAWLLPHLQPLGVWYTILATLAVGVFFLSQAAKYRDPNLGNDAARRLRLLFWGSVASLTPLFLLFARSWAFGMPMDDGFLLAISILMLFLFPVTLAYVIVVEQAMNVRVVVRQGVQYALASGSLRAVQILASALLVWAALVLARNPEVSPLEEILLISLGFAAVFLLRRPAARLRRWMDRRFFREQYDAELLLGELSEQVRGMMESEALLKTVAHRIAKTLHVEKLAIFVEREGVLRPALAVGYEIQPEVGFARESGVVRQLWRAGGALRLSAEDGGSRRQRVGLPTEERALLQRIDARLLLPLSARDGLLGFMSLGSKRSEEPYSSSDLRVLQTVAAQTGLALENSRLASAVAAEMAQREVMNREVEIAGEVQRRLFPQHLPAVDGLDYAGHCRPARQVGGDYYDFLPLPGGQFGLAIADISGKGIPAALLMASLQASVRAQALYRPENLAAVMTNVNRLIFEASPANLYATFFYAQYQPSTGRLVYVNAGHNPPFVLRGAGTIRLESGGAVVGLLPAAEYEQGEVRLEGGDVLVLFTDGVSEAMNQSEQEWGEEPLIGTVRARLDRPAAEIIPAVIEAADRFAGDVPQHDDITLVVVRVLASAQPASAPASPPG